MDSEQISKTGERPGVTKADLGNDEVLGGEIRKLTNSTFALVLITLSTSTQLSTGLSKGASARGHYPRSHFDKLSVIRVVNPVCKLIRIIMSLRLGLVQFQGLVLFS